MVCAASDVVVGVVLVVVVAVLIVVVVDVAADSVVDVGSAGDRSSGPHCPCCNHGAVVVGCSDGAVVVQVMLAVALAVGSPKFVICGNCERYTCIVGGVEALGYYTVLWL